MSAQTEEAEMTIEGLRALGIKKPTKHTVTLYNMTRDGEPRTLEDFTEQTGMSRNILFMSLGEMVREGLLAFTDAVREGGKPSGKIITSAFWQLPDPNAPQPEKKAPAKKAPAKTLTQKAQQAATGMKAEKKLSGKSADALAHMRAHAEKLRAEGVDSDEGRPVKEIEAAMQLPMRSLAGALDKLARDPDSGVVRKDVPRDKTTYKGFAFDMSKLAENANATASAAASTKKAAKAAPRKKATNKG